MWEAHVSRIDGIGSIKQDISSLLLSSIIVTTSWLFWKIFGPADSGFQFFLGFQNELSFPPCVASMFLMSP